MLKSEGRCALKEIGANLPLPFGSPKSARVAAPDAHLEEIASVTSSLTALGFSSQGIEHLIGAVSKRFWQSAAHSLQEEIARQETELEQTRERILTLRQELGDPTSDDLAPYLQVTHPAPQSTLLHCLGSEQLGPFLAIVNDLKGVDQKVASMCTPAHSPPSGADQRSEVVEVAALEGLKEARRLASKKLLFEKAILQSVLQPQLGNLFDTVKLDALLTVPALEELQQSVVALQSEWTDYVFETVKALRARSSSALVELSKIKEVDPSLLVLPTDLLNCRDGSMDKSDIDAVIHNLGENITKLLQAVTHTDLPSIATPSQSLLKLQSAVVSLVSAERDSLKAQRDAMLADLGATSTPSPPASAVAGGAVSECTENCLTTRCPGSPSEQTTVVQFTIISTETAVVPAPAVSAQSSPYAKIDGDEPTPPNASETTMVEPCCPTVLSPTFCSEGCIPCVPCATNPLEDIELHEVVGDDFASLEALIESVGENESRRATLRRRSVFMRAERDFDKLIQVIDVECDSLRAEIEALRLPYMAIQEKKAKASIITKMVKRLESLKDVEREITEGADASLNPKSRGYIAAMRRRDRQLQVVKDIGTVEMKLRMALQAFESEYGEVLPDASQHVTEMLTAASTSRPRVRPAPSRTPRVTHATPVAAAPVSPSANLKKRARSRSAKQPPQKK